MMPKETSRTDSRKLRQRIKSAVKNLNHKKVVMTIGPIRYSISAAIKHDMQDFVGHYLPYVQTEDLYVPDFFIHLRKSYGLRRYFGPQAIIEGDYPSIGEKLPWHMARIAMEMAMNYHVVMGINRFLILHGAGLQRDGRSVILTNPSGSGKSTLAAYLGYHGWQFMGDELILLDPWSEGRHRPFPRPVSLKNESIEAIAAHIPQASLSKAIANTPKGRIAFLKPPEDAIAHMQQSAVTKLVIFPTYRKDADAQLEPLPRSEALIRLIQASPNYRTLGIDSFHCLIDMVERCSFYHLTYSRFEQAQDMIEQCWKDTA